MIGRRFSHYEVVELLGSGGMGTVYRALDTVLGRSVALKFPHPHLLRDPQARERFLREARAVSALDHPNVVVLFDIGEAEGEVFLAMQHVEGRSLRQRIEAGLPPLAETIAIGRAVADALAHAHGRGVIHRDLKPDNILVTPDGRVKVADFGTARLIDENQITQAGAVLGTGGYLAPELLQGGPAEAAADLFALGAVLYELCSGRAAFQGEGPAAVFYQTLHQDPPPLPDSIPGELRELIGRLLEKDPARRPPGAVAVANALADLGAPRRTSSPAGSTPPARSIAVLYFDNLTGSAEDEYFCAGITEDLLTEIQKIPDLKVASRTAVTALRGERPDLEQAGRRLGVATVLEGGVRRAPGRVRVTARLVRADSGYQMWAERYDRGLEDIFEVQEDIARNIANSLRLALAPEDAEARLGRRTANPKAYDLRLRALALYRRFEEIDMREAIALLEEAVGEDPAYALARADLGECQVQLICKQWETDPAWLDRAEGQIRRALELAPSLPEGHRAMGHLWNHRRNLERGLRDFHHAVDLDPRFVGALNALSNNYLYLGDPSRAEVYARRGLEVDPSDGRVAINLSNALLRQRRFAECRDAVRSALRLGLGSYYTLACFDTLLLSYAWENAWDEVERLRIEIERDLPDDPGFRTLRALAAAHLGRLDEGRELLAADPGSRNPSITESMNRARIRVLLGDRDGALAELEQIIRFEPLDLHEIRIDPLLETVTDDPRFQKMAASQS